MTKALDSALRLLARREHGAIELCDKLKKRGYTQAEAKDALEACQDLGLQSDTRFAESYTRSRIRQGYGPVKIAQELKTRSIDIEIIQTVLNEEKDNWLQYALHVWQKKARGEQDLSFVEKQKQQRFLLYRGFDTDVISQVIKELA